MTTETSSGASGLSGSPDGGMVPNQLAILVPSFDPSKDGPRKSSFWSMPGQRARLQNW